MHAATVQRRVTTSTGQDPGRELLQTRLALFGRVGALLSLIYLVLVNLFHPAPRTLDTYLCSANATVLGVTTTMGLIWLLTRSAPRFEPQLRAVDAMGTVMVCILTALYGWISTNAEGSTYAGLLATTNVLTFRAAVIPSSARRTLGVGIAGAAPAITLALAQRLLPELQGQGTDNIGYVLAWCAVGVVISSVVSGVIFGLQQRARRAERLGQYELLERIGAGAMGEVFRARHAMLRRPTAIKLLAPKIAGAANILRFEREVQHTAALTHPNTIAIYDYGRTPDGLFYYAMEFLDGTDLQRLVERQGPQRPARVIHILRQICGSLAEAHDAGLVHRDVKPANVFLCHRGGIEDVVKVLDFGLVRRVDDEKEVHLAGTPVYMAPEVIRDPGTVSPLADLYAVGALGYFLLSGLVPIDGPSVRVILSRVLGDDPEPPSARIDHDLPEDLEAVIMACLDKAPAGRPRSARAMERALAGCHDAQAPQPAPQPATLGSAPSATPRTAEATMGFDDS